ncbi:MAG TPA: hypothetical protein VFH80_32270 [Solirubrobacteraceae bacterium]|nr:hypothetical protein [Solirubrobacteraceae bacterium]
MKLLRTTNKAMTAQPQGGRPATHQTVRLSRGRHSSPDRGACVMELASMLDSGPFTDHPRSVCPVIAAFLRNYNDWVDDRRRQDLYAYAAKTVGSRSSRTVEEARTRRLMKWAAQLEQRRVKRLPIGCRPWVNPSDPEPGDVASWVVYAIARQKDHPHEEVLLMIDELLEIGRTRRAGRARIGDGHPPTPPERVTCLVG